LRLKSVVTLSSSCFCRGGGALGFDGFVSVGLGVVGEGVGEGGVGGVGEGVAEVGAGGDVGAGAGV
jgi:hypothetical protein